MKSSKWVLSALLLGISVARVQAAPLQGEYVEARSASVYAGPCHYSNEAVTEGRQATVAWNFKSGDWKGVNLSGLSAVAVMRADENLAENGTSRRSVLYLDARATHQQMQALRSLFTEKFGSTLGKVLSVRATTTAVANDGLNYRVRVGETAAPAVQLDVNRYACKHCTQDQQIWYQPLSTVENVLVGKTTQHQFRDAGLGLTWNDAQEANSAFVGSFTL
jgi:hypothetical protein